MAKKVHVSETPATAFLKAHGIVFTEHPYEYLEHGGAQHSAQVLGLDPFSVVKTLIMQNEAAEPLVVLMHGNKTVSTKNLARHIGAKSVALWHSPQDAGVHRAQYSRATSHLHQWWSAWVLGWA